MIQRLAIGFYDELAEIPAAKRTPCTFSIYNSALLVTHRVSALVFTRRLSKNHHTLLSRPAQVAVILHHRHSARVSCLPRVFSSVLKPALYPFSHHAPGLFSEVFASLH
jgi:hypothetical protein